MIALLIVLLAPPTDHQLPSTPTPTGERAIELHIQPCTIPQAEEAPVPYKAASAADCARINRATLPHRRLRRLRLKAGKYAFLVFNKGATWPVDFSLRGADQKGLPHTEGGAMKVGEGLRYRITLTPGRYRLSSPKGGTPDYDLLVEGK